MITKKFLISKNILFYSVSDYISSSSRFVIDYDKSSATICFTNLLGINEIFVTFEAINPF